MQHETFAKNSHDTHAPGQPDEIFPAQAEPVEAPVDLRSSTTRQAQGEREGESPATDAYGRTPDRWTGSGDPDDPTAGMTDREYDIYWAGVRDSIREDRRANAAPLPAAAAPAGRAYDADPGDALVRPWLDDFESGMRAEAYRDGGWNPRRQRVFLEALADSGIVTQACRAASISPRAAYNLRNRDAIFAEAWVAAQALARQRLADDLLERALRGQADRIVRNGEVIAERHRTDNRLALGLLTRLDRQAEPDAPWMQHAPDHSPTPHKVLMAHWDQYLDNLSPPHLDGGAEGVAQQQRDREAVEGSCTQNPPYFDGEGDHPQDGGGVCATSGQLPSDNPEGHTQLHTREPVAGRCELHELVRTLAASDASPSPDADAASEDEAETDRHDIWQDENDEWRTDYPPPPGFTGWQSGDYGDYRYARALAPQESAIAAHWEEEDAEEESATLAQAQAQRRAAFGLSDEDEDEGEDKDAEENLSPPHANGGIADDPQDQRDREAVEENCETPEEARNEALDHRRAFEGVAANRYDDRAGLPARPDQRLGDP